MANRSKELSAGTRNCGSNKSLQSKEPFKGSSRKNLRVFGWWEIYIVKTGASEERAEYRVSGNERSVILLAVGVFSKAAVLAKIKIHWQSILNKRNYNEVPKMLFSARCLLWLQLCCLIHFSHPHSIFHIRTAFTSTSHLPYLSLYGISFRITGLFH